MRPLTIFKIFIALISSAFLQSCSKKSPDIPQPTSLAITALSADHGPYGTKVEITGTNFDVSGVAGTVQFNGKNAVITKWGNTKIEATVPLGAGTGPITIIVNGSVLIGPTFTYDFTPSVSTFDEGTFQQEAYYSWSILSSTYGIAFDFSGNMYVSNSNISNPSNNVIMEFFPPTPTSTGWAYIGAGATGVSLDGGLYSATFTFPGGMICKGSTTYVADAGEIRKITIDGTLYTISTIAGSPGAYNFTDLAIDKAGNLYATDMQNNVIQEISPMGVISVFAGSGHVGSDDGTGAAASFNQPAGITIDGSGNLFVTDQGSNLIRKITKSGVVTTIAGTGSKGATNGNSNHASFNNPTGITVDALGNLYVADYGNFSIREIQPDGTVTTLAGGGFKGYNDGQNPSFSYPTKIIIGYDGAFYITDRDRVRRLVIE